MAETPRKAGAATAARKRAREAVAAALQAQRERIEANETDLETVLRHQDELDSATEVRDTAIAKAHALYERTTSEALGAASAALQQIKERGLTDSEVGDLTGLSPANVRKFLKTGKAKRADTEPQQPEQEALGESA